MSTFVSTVEKRYPSFSSRGGLSFHQQPTPQQFYFQTGTTVQYTPSPPCKATFE